MHLPLHRQSERFACEGVDIDVSTLCDWIGAISVATEVEVIRKNSSKIIAAFCKQTRIPGSARLYRKRRGESGSPMF
jgi:hypothetical protein